MRCPWEKCADLGTCRSFSWTVKSIKKVKFEWEIGLGFTVLKAICWHLFPCLSFLKIFYVICFSFCVWNENKHQYVKGCHLLSSNAVLHMKGSCEDIKWALSHSCHSSQMFTVKSESMWERIKSPNCHRCSPNKKILTLCCGNYTYFWEHPWQTESYRCIWVHIWLS